jgi:cytochrome oxidase Cu insertion factor (SCO1/SenC/PrrC family)
MRSMHLLLFTVFSLTRTYTMTQSLGDSDIYPRKYQGLPIYIRGKVRDDLNTIKSIQLLYDLQYRNLNGKAVNFSSTVVPIGGEFVWILPPTSIPRKISNIVFDNSKILAYNKFNNLNDYIVEPGDSIQMNVEFSPMPMVSYSGRGASKYNCRAEIEQLLWQFDKEWNDEITSIDKWRLGDLESFLQKHNTFKIDLLKRLGFYKKSVSRLIYEILKADIISEIDKKILDVFSLLIQYSNNKNITHVQTMQMYAKYTNPDPYCPRDIELVPNMVSFLTYKAAFDLLIQNSGKEPCFKDVYFRIKDKYVGRLREAMIFLLLTDEKSLSNMFESRFSGLELKDAQRYVQDAKALIKTKSIKEQLVQFGHRYEVKSEAFDFSLPDSEGKTIRLNDFRGKVVIVDIWFTGCGGCAQFSDRFKRYIKPLFKNDTNFSTISICTDVNKNTWLRSLESEKYSSKEDINVYTNGEGFNHDIIKYYGLVGLPFVLLISKEGKIVDVITKLDNDVIITKIRKALEGK